MDDKTDKTDETDMTPTTDETAPDSRTMPHNESTMPYSTVPYSTVPDGRTPDSRTDESRTGESRTGDGAIQDKVDNGKAPTRPRGPNASAIVVGLVAMVLAGLVIAKETMGFHVDWSRLGPVAIVGLGVVMLLIGAIGLVRRQDSDV